MSSQHLLRQDIVWIATNEALDSVCEQWQDLPLLTLDTEFERTKTYYPIAGLLQINDGCKNYLIDPTTIDDFYPLVELFENPAITFVLHSCSEDLEVFHNTFNCLPRTLFDTQIAAALAGHAFSMGYANLVREALQVELPKSETRSDWLQRPLSVSQMHYAAIDVEYLFMLAKQLMARLRELGRLDWALEDGRSLRENFFVNQNPDLSYLRFKMAWKLNARQLLALQGLSRWREDLAQDRDMPRNRILKEPALFAIAQRGPNHLAQLRDFEGMSERMIRQHGEQILAIVAAANAAPEEALPEPQPAPLNATERATLDQLRHFVHAKGAELGIASEILVKKKEYEAMIVDKRRGEVKLPKSLQGWREAVVGQGLLAVLVS